ncbi:MAG: hypothetical protein ACYTG0_39175 [Planctomycetota bacterium]|jgi:hypothetical protein
MDMNACTQIETVKLRTGIVEAKALVTSTMHSLKHLLDTKPIVLYELVMRCRDPKHELFGGSDLVHLGLLQKTNKGHYVHESIRNIVLAAVDGDGLDMALRSPIG